MFLKFVFVKVLSFKVLGCALQNKELQARRNSDFSIAIQLLIGRVKDINLDLSDSKMRVPAISQWPNKFIIQVLLYIEIYSKVKQMFLNFQCILYIKAFKSQNNTATDNAKY